MKKLIYLVPVLLLAIAACKKDANPSPNPNQIYQDTIPNDSIDPDTVGEASQFIEIGNSSGMNVTACDLNIDVPNDLGCNIDFDGDHEPDLNFIYYSHYTPGIGTHSNIEVYGYYNQKVKLFGSAQSTTVYEHCDVSSVPLSSGPSKVQTTYHYSWSCNQMLGDSDRVYKQVDVPFVAQPVQLNQKIFANMVFQVTTLKFQSTGAPTKSSEQYYTSNDTSYAIIHSDANPSDNCEKFQVSPESHYIAFKMGVGSNRKLGWIKFIVYSPTKLKITEYAISK